MSGSSGFTVQIEKRVAYVEINHPPVNALNSKLIRELTQCIDELAENADVKAIVITGQGKFFAAGADIKAFASLFGDESGATALATEGHALFQKLESLRKPVIAAINGICLGGGLELAMSCHMRFAANEAVLGLPELKLGLIPGYGGTQRLARLTNKAKALELILTGKSVQGEEAERIGLVNRAVPATELMASVKQLAEEMASGKSAVSIEAALEAVTRGLELAPEEGYRLEAQLFGKLFGSEDTKEGVTAFIEKRKAQFRDR